MNINKEFMEIFDVYTNDYKIVRKVDYEKKNNNNSSWARCPNFFQRRMNRSCFNDNNFQNLHNAETKRNFHKENSDDSYNRMENNRNAEDYKNKSRAQLQNKTDEKIISENDLINEIKKNKRDYNECDDEDESGIKGNKNITELEKREGGYEKEYDSIRLKQPGVNSKIQREAPAGPPIQPAPPQPIETQPIPPLRQSQQDFVPQQDFGQRGFGPQFQPGFGSQQQRPFAPTPPFTPQFSPSPVMPSPQPTPFFPRPVQPFPPISPQFPQQTSASRRVIILLNQLYYELGNLQNIYLQLSSTAPDSNTANFLNGYANEVVILRQAVFEIYRSLTGRILYPTSINFPPPILTGDFCTDLVTAVNYASSIQSITLQLLRIIDINTINRQLTIISVTLNNQINGLNNLFGLC